MDAIPHRRLADQRHHRRNKHHSAISVAIKPFIDAAFPVCIRAASLSKPKGYGPSATIALPQSGLYTVNTSPSSPYLVETNPRFTQYNNFITSDYLLSQLGYAPDAMLKRLGDGFYEEQQVLDQITDLTGRRFLTNESDALDQYRTRMSNAVTMDQQFGFSRGSRHHPQRRHRQHLCRQRSGKRPPLRHPDDKR